MVSPSNRFGSQVSPQATSLRLGPGLFGDLPPAAVSPPGGEKRKFEETTENGTVEESGSHKRQNTGKLVWLLWHCGEAMLYPAKLVWHCGEAMLYR